MTTISWDEVAEAKILRETKAPYPGIIIEVVDYPQYPGLRHLRFYADNLYDFSDSQIQSIGEWIKLMLDTLNSQITSKKYTYEVR